MERDFDRPSPQDAAESLASLSRDNDHLAENVQVSRTLLAAFGGIAAWWVSAAAFTTPGDNYQPPSSSWLALVAVLIVAYLIRRESGVKFQSMGARASLAFLGILVTCLALFSASLGLVSLGMQWAVALTSLLAFGTTMWLAGVAYRSAADKLRDE